MRAVFEALLLAVALIVLRCSPPPPDPLEDLPASDRLVEDPARLPKPPQPAPQTVAVSDILVSYRGAVDAWNKIKLDHDQARLRAGRLLVLARSKGHDFAELARKFSDDAKNSESGGSLGVVGRGQLHPDLERAAFGLGLGQVSNVVETPRGFEIVERHEPDEAQAAEIVVGYTGGRRYKPRTERSRDQAASLAREIRAQIAAGQSFAELAEKYSDLPNNERGGYYPIFRKGTRNPKFEKIVWNLPLGGVSEVIETGTGFHIVERLPVRRIQLRLLAIGFSEAKSTGQDGGRSRAQARALAYDLLRRLLDDKADFAALASEYSEGLGNDQGGLVRPVGRAEIPYPVEKVAFSMAVGEISGVIETSGQFQIVKLIR